MPNAFDFANPPFDRLAPQELETLRKVLDIAYFRPGETVIASGVPVEALYVVIKGFVEERAGDEPVALLGPKDSFDSRALVAGPHRQCLRRPRGDAVLRAARDG